MRQDLVLGGEGRNLQALIKEVICVRTVASCKKDEKFGGRTMTVGEKSQIDMKQS